MAYVYRHIRLDKNEPFYIGISKYKSRCFIKKGRNNLWQKIVGKTKYKVEIIFDNLSWEDACKKEMELIKKYGKINNGDGILANLTDGGEGCFGLIPKNRKKIVQKDFNNKIIKIYDCISDVAKDGFTKSGVNTCCRKKQKFHKGFVWQYFNEQNDDLSFNKSPEKRHKKPVIQKDLNGNVLKIWDSMTEAINNNLNCTSNGIGMCCNKRMLTHAGFMWDFVNPMHITRKGKESFRKSRYLSIL